METFSKCMAGFIAAIVIAMVVLANPRVGDLITLRHATDGAYRDGAYLGRLDATQGRTPNPAIGRWSRVPDRASFALGYSRAYSEVAASHSRNADQATVLLVKQTQ